MQKFCMKFGAEAVTKCVVRAAAYGGRQHMLYHLIKAGSGAGRNDTNILLTAPATAAEVTQKRWPPHLSPHTRTRIMQMKAVKLYGGRG